MINAVTEEACQMCGAAHLERAATEAEPQPAHHEPAAGPDRVAMEKAKGEWMGKISELLHILREEVQMFATILLNRCKLRYSGRAARVAPGRGEL